MSIGIEVRELTKRFSRYPAFTPVTFTIEPSTVFAVVGVNGAGKSTLLKILAGVLAPTKGSIQYRDNSTQLKREEIETRSALVAPYLELYPELTAIEHLRFVADLRGKTHSDSVYKELLLHLGLKEEALSSTRYLSGFSSGMRQRVKIAMALTAEPDLLFLDEPTSNLDADGIAVVEEQIRKVVSRGTTVILATNEERERKLATSEIMLTPYQQ